MKEFPITGISKLQSWDQSGPFARVCTDSKYFYIFTWFLKIKRMIFCGKNENYMKFSRQCPEKQFYWDTSVPI